MKEELELKLQNEFAFMQRKFQTGDDIDLKNNYQSFGCECSDGWYELIRELCTSITEQYRQFEIPIDIVIEQVKEKYGTLRFYYSFDNELNGAQYDLLKDSIVQIVDSYEFKSETTCQKCGKYGSLREGNPLVETLCNECYDIQIKKRKERKCLYIYRVTGVVYFTSLQRSMKLQGYLLHIIQLIQIYVRGAF